MNEASGSTYLQDSMPPKSGRLWWVHLGFTSTGCFKRSMHIEHTGVKSIRPRHPEGNAAQNTLSVECWLYACPPLTLTSAFHIVVIIEFLFLSLGRQRAKGISSNSSWLKPDKRRFSAFVRMRRGRMHSSFSHTRDSQAFCIPSLRQIFRWHFNCWIWWRHCRWRLAEV